MVAAALDHRAKVATAGEITLANTSGTTDNLFKSGFSMVKRGAEAVVDKAIDAVGKPMHGLYHRRIQNKSNVKVATSALALKSTKRAK